MTSIIFTLVPFAFHSFSNNAMTVFVEERKNYELRRWNYYTANTIYSLSLKVSISPFFFFYLHTVKTFDGVNASFIWNIHWVIIFSDEITQKLPNHAVFLESSLTAMVYFFRNDNFGFVLSQTTVKKSQFWKKFRF